MTAHTGVWRWAPVPGIVADVYALIAPDGQIRGHWWPEGDPPDGIHGLLAELALTLQDREVGECVLCRGSVLRNGLCSGCLQAGDE